MGIFDDITPPKESTNGNHSIQNVTPLKSKERDERRVKRSKRRRVSSPVRSTKKGGGNTGIWIVAIIVVSIMVSAIGFVFIGKTTLSVTPQTETINLSPNVVYTAYKQAENTELGYHIIDATIKKSDSLPANGSEKVSEKASGRITVYNTYSSASQRLIKNTRFESPNGDIYRIRGSITVPGKHKDGTPGSIDVTVYADDPGKELNISAPKTKFTIPGLKGDPRYDAFYAELKTPITGGFVGVRAVVNKDELNAKRNELRDKIKSEIPDTLHKKIADTDMMFDTMVFTTFESSPVTYTDKNTATVEEVAHIQTVAFNKKSFAHMIAITALASPESGDILIDNPEAINATLINKEGVDINTDSLIQFSISGTVHLTWDVDEAALKNDLVGKKSAALNTVLSGYPGIKTAQATIRPFWKKEFPKDAGNIIIEIVKPK